MNNQNTIYVSWQDKDAFENINQLKQIFDQFGQVEDVIMKENFAFVNYINENSAKEAVESVNNFKINDQILKVAFTKPALIIQQCFNCGMKGHIARECPKE